MLEAALASASLAVEAKLTWGMTMMAVEAESYMAVSLHVALKMMAPSTMTLMVTPALLAASPGQAAKMMATASMMAAEAADSSRYIPC